MNMFFKELRRGTLDIGSYVNKFESNYAKLESCGVILPDTVKAWFLMDKAMLSSERRSNVLTAAGDEYNYSELRKALLLNCGDVGKHDQTPGRREGHRQRRFGSSGGGVGGSLPKRYGGGGSGHRDRPQKLISGKLHRVHLTDGVGDQVQDM